MAEPGWTIEKVDEFKKLLLKGDLERIKSFLEEEGLGSLPARIEEEGNEYVSYQGHFSYEWLWGTLAFHHDIELYEFFRGMGMPLINEMELAESRWGRRDETFSALNDDKRRDWTYKPNKGWSEVAGYFERLLDDGWKPCGGETRPHRIWEALYIYMPVNPGLLKRLEDAGFDVRPETIPNYYWSDALDWDRPTSIAYFVECGHTIDAPIAVGKKAHIEALNAAIDAGLNIAYVFSNCSREILIRCAEVGAKPVSVLSRLRNDYGIILDSSEVLYDWREDELKPGDAEICESLDYEVIEAFVSRGLLGFLTSESAREAGREDIVALLESHKRDAVVDGAEKSIRYGAPYAHDDVIEVPEGVECIEEKAFEGIFATEIKLPNSLKTIKFRAFGGPVMPETVTIPKGVTHVEHSTFYGTNKFVIYDTINPKEEWQVNSPSAICRLGVRPETSICPVVPLYDNFEITVKSAVDDSIKYRVWLPYSELSGFSCKILESALESAWGPNAEFSFTKLDGLFESMPNVKAKCRTAINRLLWPVELGEKERDVYEKYLSGKGTIASKQLIDDDDLDGMKKLEPLGIITKNNVKDLLLYAKAGNYAPKLAKYLEDQMDAYGARPKKTAKGLKWNRKRVENLALIASRNDVMLLEEYLSYIEDGMLPPIGYTKEEYCGYLRRRSDDPQSQIWEACIANGSAEAAKFLITRGLDLDNGVGAYLLAGWSWGPRIVKKLREFISEMIDCGLDFTGCKAGGPAGLRGYKGFFKYVGHDRAFYDKLEKAGLSYEDCDKETRAEYLS